MFRNLPRCFQVTRYHSLQLKNLPPMLDVLLETGKGEIMAIAHQSLPLVGIQFHPEAHLTDFGMDMIRAWIAANNLNRPVQTALKAHG